MKKINLQPKTKRLIKLFATLFSLLAIFIGSCFIFTYDNLRDGKVTLDLNIEKNNTTLVENNIDTFDEFKDFFNAYVDQLNSYGTNDFYSANKYKDAGDKYVVNFSTRRLDKLQNLGNFRYGKGDKLFVNDNTSEKHFNDIYDGKVRQRMNRKYFDESVSFYTFNTNMKVRMNDVKNDNKTFTSQEVIDTIKAKNNYVAYFELCDLSFVNDITFKVYGDVKYYSNLTIGGIVNNNIEIHNNTVTIHPVEVSAKKDGGDAVNVNAFVGYIVYTQHLSPILLGLIISGGVALCLAIYLLFFKGYFKKIFNKHNFAKIKRYKLLYLLILPALVLLILFRYLPDIYLSAAFMDYDLLDGLSSEFIGGKYFMNIFLAKNTADMYRVFRNTIFISLIRIISNIPFILFLAVVINSMKNKKVKTVFQAFSLIPYFLSWVAIGGVFYSFLNSETGLVARLLSITTDIYTIPEPWWALLSLSSLYKGMGWSAIIYIAGMCQIDTGLYEAAKIDGCNKFRQATNVTLPSIMPVICLQLILDVANVLKDNYDQILAMLNGSISTKVYESVDVVGRIAYSALEKSNFGSATAIGLIQSAIGCLLVVVANRIVKKTDNEGIM